MERSGVLFGACALALAGTLLLVAGCSASKGAEPGLKSGAVSTEATVSVLGPYRSGVKVVAGSVEYELLGVRVMNPAAIRLSERTLGGPFAERTLAAAGRNYVDVTVRVRSLDATTGSNARPPRIGVPYVLAGGQRFASVDGAARLYQPPAPRAGETPASVEHPDWLTPEYELSTTTPDAVFYLPTSETATQVVAFRLW